MDYWVEHFFDMSYWQGDVNMAEVKDKRVMLRVTVGGTYRDPRFPVYHEGAENNGIDVIGYLAINPLFSAEAHWTNFTEHLAGRHIVGIVFDVEMSGGLSAAAVRVRVQEICELFRSRLPEMPMLIYTGDWFWTPWIGNVLWALAFGLHVAQYPWLTPPDELPDGYRPTAIPEPWKNDQEPLALQWTDKGWFPEITTDNTIDRNAATQEFVDLFDGPVEPPPVEPPEPVEMITVYPTTRVNYRGGPGTEYPVRGVLEPGRLDYPVYDEVVRNGTDYWVKIGNRDGFEAWAARIWRNPSTGVVYELMQYVAEDAAPIDDDPPFIDPVETMQVLVKVDRTVAWEETVPGERPVIETNAFTKYSHDGYKWERNDVITTNVPPAVTANGGAKFFRFPYQSPEGKDLYIRKKDVVQIVP